MQVCRFKVPQNSQQLFHFSYKLSQVGQMHNETPTMGNQFDAVLLAFRKAYLEIVEKHPTIKPRELNKKLIAEAQKLWPNELEKTNANKVSAIKLGERFWLRIEKLFAKLRYDAFHVISWESYFVCVLTSWLSHAELVCRSMRSAQRSAHTYIRSPKNPGGTRGTPS